MTLWPAPTTTRSRRRRSSARPRIDDEELTALVERVWGHLEAGAYPVDPDLDRKACSYCGFDLVCRMGPRIERKRQGGDLP